tara:strand:+ start:82 stop:207 length:126 start_codon:yes stop_codon:yes gene_type:complete
MVMRYSNRKSEEILETGLTGFGWLGQMKVVGFTSDPQEQSP